MRSNEERLSVYCEIGFMVLQVTTSSSSWQTSSMICWAYCKRGRPVYLFPFTVSSSYVLSELSCLGICLVTPSLLDLFYTLLQGTFMFSFSSKNFFVSHCVSPANHHHSKYINLLFSPSPIVQVSRVWTRQHPERMPSVAISLLSI